jgi:hypothetical protein
MKEVIDKFIDMYGSIPEANEISNGYYYLLGLQHSSNSKDIKNGLEVITDHMLKLYNFIDYLERQREEE